MNLMRSDSDRATKSETKMKTIWPYIILLQALFSYQLVEAQPKLEVGFLAGANLSELTIEDDGSDLGTENRTLFAFGSTIEYRIAGRTSVRLSPLYVKKGTNFEISPDISWEFDYLDLVLLLKVDLTETQVRPYLIVGSNAGFLLSARATTTNIKDDLKTFDFGVNLGGGITVPVSRVTLFLEGYYNHGLVNISDTIVVESIKNKGMRFMLGLTFPVGS